MKYYIYNKLSKFGHKKTSSNMLDVSSLSSDFFLNLTTEDEVELHGGDGTINNFINKCIEYPKLTIVKSGTGNDLARSLTKEYKDVSVFSANGYKYVNGFDVGFGALVCKLVNEDRRKGTLSYFKNVYLGLRQVNTQDMEVTIDGRIIKTKRSFLITAQNTEYFGGGMKVTPNAQIEEPTVEVCVIGNASKLLLATVFPTIFISQHTKFKKYVQTYTGKNIHIKLPKSSIAECDGEVLAAATEFKIKYVGTIKIRNK